MESMNQRSLKSIWTHHPSIDYLMHKLMCHVHASKNLYKNSCDIHTNSCTPIFMSGKGGRRALAASPTSSDIHIVQPCVRTCARLPDQCPENAQGVSCNPSFAVVRMGVTTAYDVPEHFFQRLVTPKADNITKYTFSNPLIGWGATKALCALFVSLQRNVKLV